MLKFLMAETYKMRCCEKDTWITLGLFFDVSNSAWLRSEATSGRVEAALLDPSLVSSQS